jgi:hypothetical protein
VDKTEVGRYYLVVLASWTSEKRLVFSLAPLNFPLVDEAHIWFFVVTQCVFSPTEELTV